MEQIEVNRFCLKLKKAATETLKCLKVYTMKNVYREQVFIEKKCV
jgi:hypothetical protein